jgi:hypothetical protein
VPNRKSATGTSPKNSIVGTTREITIAVVVTIVRIAQAARSP